MKEAKRIRGFETMPRGSVRPALCAWLLVGIFTALLSLPLSAAVVVNETSLVSGSYTVPNSGQVTITIKGADGGDATAGGTVGGEGAQVSATFDVTAGQVIRYVVGEAGVNNALTNGSAGGGGSTGVYIDTTRVLVAGAGGGGDNSADALGLGGNTGTAGDLGTGTGAGAGGTGGNGGAATSGTTTGAGGGGGVNSAGGNGTSSTGGGRSDQTVGDTGVLLAIAAGGAGATNGTPNGTRGGQGFTGGGGAGVSYSGGAGGYSGGGAAGAGGAAGGGGSYVNTSATGYVSSTTTAGTNGGGTQSDGLIQVDFESSASLSINKSFTGYTDADGSGDISAGEHQRRRYAGILAGRHQYRRNAADECHDYRSHRRNAELHPRTTRDLGTARYSRRRRAGSVHHGELFK
jgi:hypothetical protein